MDVASGQTAGRIELGGSQVDQLLGVGQLQRAQQRRIRRVSGESKPEPVAERAWELERNAPVRPAVPGPEGWIGSVAVGVVGARPAIAAAGASAEIADDTRFINTVGTWDLERGTPTGQPIDGLHLREVRVTALSALVGNRLVLATATKDEATSTAQVRVWDLERGTPIGQAIHDLNSDISTMTVGELGGRSIVAIAGGAFGQNGWAQVRDLERGRLVGKAAIVSERPIQHVALAELDGSAVLVAVGGGRFRSDDGWVQSWTLEQGTPLGQVIQGLEGEVRSVAASFLGGRPVAIAGTSDGLIYICDLAESTIRTVIDIDSRVNSVAFGSQGIFVTGTAMGLVVLGLV
jgi:WD40 repeat protein